jgi:restriction system protein
MVMGEGATRGLLMTTSDYSRDSYKFVKDKPITLLNGSNLLASLEKYGHRAYHRRNTAEAELLPLYGRECNGYSGNPWISE